MFDFFKKNWFPALIGLATCLCSYIFFQKRTFPVVPTKQTKGVILESDQATDAYYLLDCTLYDNGKLILSFAGKYCGFFPEDRFVSYQDSHLRLIDKSKNILWDVNVNGHHDISISEERNEVGILFSRESEKYGYIHGVKVFDESGKEIFTWDVLSRQEQLEKIFKKNFETIRKEYNLLKVRRKDYAQAFIKINSLQIIPPTPIYPEIPHLKPGNILMNLQHQTTFIIIDRDTKEIVWHTKTPGSSHAAKVTKKGYLTFFNNKNGDWFQSSLQKFIKLSLFYPTSFLGKNGELRIEHEPGNFDVISSSMIRKYDFKKKKYVWTYSHPNYFYSGFLGYAQPLANGNILVTHITRGGCAFEVNEDKEIVWEWINPEWDEELNWPRSVYKITKVDKKLAEKFLEEEF